MKKSIKKTVAASLIALASIGGVSTAYAQNYEIEFSFFEVLYDGDNPSDLRPSGNLYYRFFINGKPVLKRSRGNTHDCNSRKDRICMINKTRKISIPNGRNFTLKGQVSERDYVSKDEHTGFHSKRHKSGKEGDYVLDLKRSGDLHIKLHYSIYKN